MWFLCFIRSALFKFHKIISQYSFCCWFLALFHCHRGRYFVWFPSFKIYWFLFCERKCGLQWGIFHVHFKSVFILLLLGGVFHWYLSSMFGLCCCASLPCLVDLLPSFSIHYWIVLHSIDWETGECNTAICHILIFSTILLGVFVIFMFASWLEPFLL